MHQVLFSRKMLIGCITAVLFMALFSLPDVLAAVVTVPVSQKEVVLPVAAILPRTGQLICYGADGKRVDFTGTGQDGEFQRGRAWPVPRFVVHNDGTVSDRLTGLMWLQNGECLGASSWPIAFDKVAALNLAPKETCGYRAKYDDWTLPTLADLSTLFNVGEVKPVDYLKLEGMRKVQKESYWSINSSPSVLNAWVAELAGNRTATKSKISKNFVLPVRVAGRISVSEGAALTMVDKEKNDKGGDQGASAALRFVVADGTVIDLATGLMWLQDLSCFSRKDWHSALDFLNGANAQKEAVNCEGYGAYTDWTMPNLVELQSLVDYAMDFPALPPKAEFKGDASIFWSSSTDAAEPLKAYVLNAETGAVEVVAKDRPLHFMVVRQLESIPLQPRIEPKEALGLTVAEDHVLTPAAELQTEIQWPPPPRFLNNGDGTSLDIVTGFTWLTDANCFEKQSWMEASRLLKRFNTDARKFDCKSYREGFDDWVMPTIEELQELFNPHVEDSVAWLNSQGVENVQDNSDYLSLTETPLNLYYALVLNMKKGMVRNYPKTLKFHVWPRRILPTGEDFVPMLNMTVNSIDQRVEVAPEDPISINVYLHTFGHRFPADFWLWYETQDGARLWLTQLRTWREKESAVYQGDLFNLNNYEIYRSDANDLAPGEYTVHFAVDAIQNGVLDNLRYEVQTVITVMGDVGIPGADGKNIVEPLLMFPAPE